MPFAVVISLAGTLLIAVSITLPAHAQINRYDTLADSAMVENRPTPATKTLLKDELLFQRATQIYLWPLPLIVLSPFGVAYLLGIRIVHAIVNRRASS